MDTLVAAFDRYFAILHRRSAALVQDTPQLLLFQSTRDDSEAIMKLNVAGNIVRAAAFVEMACGGIMTRLWDDPFEWTLPEALNSGDTITTYLEQVESTRRNAFRFFTSDADLTRMIPAPRDLRPIGDILIETLSRAEHYQGRAFALCQSIGGVKLAVR